MSQPAADTLRSLNGRLVKEMDYFDDKYLQPQRSSQSTPSTTTTTTTATLVELSYDVSSLPNHLINAAEDIYARIGATETLMTFAETHILPLCDCTSSSDDIEFYHTISAGMKLRITKLKKVLGSIDEYLNSVGIRRSSPLSIARSEPSDTIEIVVENDLQKELRAEYDTVTVPFKQLQRLQKATNILVCDQDPRLTSGSVQISDAAAQSTETRIQLQKAGCIALFFKHCVATAVAVVSGKSGGSFILTLAAGVVTGGMLFNAGRGVFMMSSKNNQ